MRFRLRLSLIHRLFLCYFSSACMPETSNLPILQVASDNLRIACEDVEGFLCLGRGVLRYSLGVVFLRRFLDSLAEQQFGLPYRIYTRVRVA